MGIVFALNAADIFSVDQQVGRIWEFLESERLWDEMALVRDNLGSQGSKSTIKLDAQDEKRLRSLG